MKILSYAHFGKPHGAQTLERNKRRQSSKYRRTFHFLTRVTRNLSTIISAPIGVDT